jgi:hypothetical protein
MKKTTKFLITFTILFIGSVFIAEYFSIANANLNGAPQGSAGDPANGKQTCRSCHYGPAPIFQAGLIQTNIPNAGYTPGATYTITANITGHSSTVFGFEVTTEDTVGNFLGTLISINNNTSLIPTNSSDNNKYITHTYASNFSTNHSETWVFEWVAPAAGSGSITFYGAFNVANGDGYQSYDTIYTSTTNVLETQGSNTAVSNVNELIAMDNIALYPNPVEDELIISNTETLQLTFIDMNGNTIKKIDNISKKSSVSAGDLPSGSYLLYIKCKEKVILRKIVKK